MRILEIREATVPLGATLRNATIGYEAMTVSALALVTDARRNGEPVIGYGIDSIGRYGHGGLARERFVPRLLAAAPADYADEATGGLDPFKLAAIAMRNEKPGGHGERAGAIGLIDAAAWDAVAKHAERPLWRLLAERFNGGKALARVPVYASGGHYRDGAGSHREEAAALGAELRRARALGYRTFKIKIGGATLDRDRARIEAALAVAGDGAALAVDANAALDLAAARRWLAALSPYRLAWLEEPFDPLDFESLRALSRETPLPLATGENLFSAAEAANLLCHGGLDPGRDFLQFDVSLAYGIPEFLRILAGAQAAGWRRGRFLPHAGHLFAFHVVAGLELGRHEAALDPDLLLGGFPEGVAVAEGTVEPWDGPGVGFERMAKLGPLLRRLGHRS